MRTGLTSKVALEDRPTKPSSPSLRNRRFRESWGQRGQGVGQLRKGRGQVEETQGRHGRPFRAFQPALAQRTHPPWHHNFRSPFGGRHCVMWHALTAAHLEHHIVVRVRLHRHATREQHHVAHLRHAHLGCWRFRVWWLGLGWFKFGAQAQAQPAQFSPSHTQKKQLLGAVAPTNTAHARTPGTHLVQRAREHVQRVAMAH